MPKTWPVIIAHQLVFQGMFVMKNIFLHRKIGKQIRGNNIEATVSIAFFAFLLQNLILFGLSITGSLFVHKMIMKEETYLYLVHGDAYTQYKMTVPRYLII